MEGREVPRPPTTNSHVLGKRGTKTTDEKPKQSGKGGRENLVPVPTTQVVFTFKDQPRKETDRLQKGG